MGRLIERIVVIGLALLIAGWAIYSQHRHANRTFTVTTESGRVYQNMRYKGLAGIGGGHRYVGRNGEEVIITTDHVAVEE